MGRLPVKGNPLGPLNYLRFNSKSRDCGDKVLKIDIKPSFSYDALSSKRDATTSMITKLDKKYMKPGSVARGRVRDAKER
jgi:hypothetical protein